MNVSVRRHWTDVYMIKKWTRSILFHIVISKVTKVVWDQTGESFESCAKVLTFILSVTVKVFLTGWTWLQLWFRNINQILMSTVDWRMRRETSCRRGPLVIQKQRCRLAGLTWLGSSPTWVSGNPLAPVESDEAKMAALISLTAGELQELEMLSTCEVSNYHLSFFN